MDSTTVTTTNTHDNQFLESNDLLNYDLTNHQDMLLYSSLYSTSSSSPSCHPLDSTKQQEMNTPLTSSSMNPFFDPQFQNIDNLYTNSTSSSSYLQYLQQSPMNDYQQNNNNNNDNNNKYSDVNLDLFDSKTNWMMDHLDIYMPLSNSTNDSNNFNLNHLSYLSQMKSDHPQQLNDLSHNYVNLNDVNSFVTETDAMKHNISLQSSVTNNNLKSSTLMGELSPATPSTNNSGMPTTPYTTMQQRGSYDSIDSIDDFSDSDTSSQSWLLSSSTQQDPIHGWRDPNQSSIYSSFGLSSSISTPTLSLNHQQQNFDLSMNPSFYYNHPSSLPPQYNYTTKNKSMKKGNKHLLKTRKSIPNDYLINNRQGLNLHYQQMNRKKSMPNLYYHPSSASTTSLTNKTKSSISSINKRNKELKRRESEPHSLNKLNQQHLSLSTNNNHLIDPSLYSPSIISNNNNNSESLSHFLSRQKLTDDDDLDDDLQQQENPYLLSTSSNDHHIHPLPSSSSSSTITSTTNNNNNPIKKGRNVDKACNHCKRSHLRCDNMRPCRRCISTGKTGCKDVMHKPRGRPKLHKN